MTEDKHFSTGQQVGGRAFLKLDQIDLCNFLHVSLGTAKIVLDVIQELKGIYNIESLSVLLTLVSFVFLVQ